MKNKYISSFYILFATSFCIIGCMKDPPIPDNKKTNATTEDKENLSSDIDAIGKQNSKRVDKNPDNTNVDSNSDTRIIHEQHSDLIEKRTKEIIETNRIVNAYNTIEEKFNARMELVKGLTADTESIFCELKKDLKSTKKREHLEREVIH